MRTSGWNWPFSVLLILAGLPLAAQEVRGPETGVVVVTDPVQQAREMIEDVEVLRTILEREVRSLYGADGSTGRSGAGGATGGVGLPMSGGTSMMPGMSSMGMSGNMGGMMGMAPMASMSAASGFRSRTGSDPMGSAAGSPSASRAPGRPVLGAYVEDLGIVYQLELPAFREPPPAQEQVDASQCTYLSSTEWQRTRQELRGELTVADCRKCHQVPDNASSDTSYHHDQLALRDCHKCHVNVLGAFKGNGFSTLKGLSFHLRHTAVTSGGPTREQVIDRLLRLLADNGGHIRHLTDDERIAIAISVEPRRPAHAAGASGYGSGAGGYGAEGMYDPGMGGYGGEAGMGGAGYGKEDTYGGEAGGYGPGADGASAADAGYEPDSGASSQGDSAAGSSDLGYDAPGGLLPPDGTQPTGGSGAYGLGGGSGGSPGKAAFGGSFGRPQSRGSGRIAGSALPFDPTDLHGLTGDAGNDELTGDLHLRQGQSAAAVSAYERALLNAYGMAETGPNAAVPPDAVLLDLLKQGWQPPQRRMIQKLTQAYVAAGELEKARRLLESWMKEGGRQTSGRSGKADPPRAVPLPARLVVSATKAQLDAVAADKLVGEFRQQALVRWFDPQAPDERASIKPPPADLNGIVVKVEGEFVQISLGADDGLRRGTALQVSRDDNMLAEIEVVSVDADRAVARITARYDTRDDVDPQIKPGDRVALRSPAPPGSGKGATP